MKRRWPLVAVCMACLWVLSLGDPAQAGSSKAAKAGLAAHYYRDVDYWGGTWPDTIAAPAASADGYTFSTYSYTRVEPLVNHQFIHSGWFSVRWVGSLDTSPAGQTDKTATYTFYIWADDGCRLFIDGKQVISDWRPCAEDSPTATRSGKITLAPGKHKIVVEYFQGQSLKKQDRDPMKLYWQCADRNIPKQIVPASHFSHTDDDLAPTAGRTDKK